ncbi:MAG: acyl-coenzyme A thioesterase PaaI-like protein [Cellvibrionaceae bacterium]|jgi:acyl-coenzyme A thioesterase PaaI-like protein
MISTVQTFNNQLQKKVKNWVNQVSVAQGSGSMVDKLKMSAALKLLTQFVGKSIPFAARNNFKVIDYKPGYVKAFIPLKPNKNHFNAMYAGALFTVAELPGGIISILSFDERFFPILKDLKIEFLKMAKTDVTVEFELSEKQLKQLEIDTINDGRCAFVLEGEIKDMSGEVVAKSYANYQIRLR